MSPGERSWVDRTSGKGDRQGKRCRQVGLRGRASARSGGRFRFCGSRPPSVLHQSSHPFWRNGGSKLGESDTFSGVLISNVGVLTIAMTSSVKRVEN